MDMDLTRNAIVGMRRHLDACLKYFYELERGYQSPEKFNTLLDAAMQQAELCCIDMRVLCEKVRPTVTGCSLGKNKFVHKDIFGEVNRLDNGWMDIRLNTLLPHCKVMGGTQYVSDTISRLLNDYVKSGGVLPRFEKAYVAIVEHCPFDTSGAFDSDNKGFKGVINALKGRLFNDDNQFELALGLFSVLDDESCCHIYVTPFEEAGDFLYQLTSLSL